MTLVPQWLRNVRLHIRFNMRWYYRWAEEPIPRMSWETDEEYRKASDMLNAFMDAEELNRAE